MKLIVIAPHFEPDVAPTGAVTTRLVHELAERGHTIEVVTALPWYRHHRVEEDHRGRLSRYEDAPWGRITRVHPFPTEDKTNILRRGIGFVGFTGVAGYLAARGPDADVVLSVSPPLTLGLAGIRAARRRGARFVFNIQDVYPDVAIELGYLKNTLLIRAARALERYCYERAAAITVLSDDLRDNVAAKINDESKVRVIPNFVDTDRIRPAERENSYRREHGLTDRFVVMYAGNVGLSQSLDAVVDAAAALAHEEDIAFVINGGGAGRAHLETRARGLKRLRFVDMQPAERLPEVLAAADVHLVPLRRGLARSSVPSKTYSILAAGRPLVAGVDPGSEVARIVEASGAGVAVPPDDAEALTKAVARLADDRDEARRMGEAGRRFIEGSHSPAAVAAMYERLFEELRPGR